MVDRDNHKIFNYDVLNIHKFRSRQNKEIFEQLSTKVVSLILSFQYFLGILKDNLFHCFLHLLSFIILLDSKLVHIV